MVFTVLTVLRSGIDTYAAGNILATYVTLSILVYVLACHTGNSAAANVTNSILVNVYTGNALNVCITNVALGIAVSVNALGVPGNAVTALITNAVKVNVGMLASTGSEGEAESEYKSKSSY